MNRNWPHWLIWCAALVFIPFASPIRAGDDARFPYDAVITAPRTRVHAGPGRIHYATDQLKRGTVVEVYRHDPEGWYAIRPPEGSFGLIPADAVSLTETPQVGRITASGVKCWVGSRFESPDQPLWQIELRAGERVHVLGQKELPGANGRSETWLQIAPPAGEFRWIDHRHIQPHRPGLVMNDGEQPDDPAQESGTDEFHSTEVPDNENASADGAVRQVSGQVAINRDEAQPEVAEDQPEYVSTPDGWTRRTTPRHRPDGTPLVAGNAPTRRTNTIQPSAATSSPGGRGPVQTNMGFDDRLRVVERRLTAEAIKQPDEWKLETIGKELRELESVARTPNQRERLERIQTKLTKFSELQLTHRAIIESNTSRVEDLNSLPAPQQLATEQPSLLASLLGSPDDNSDDQPYAGQGWLNRLYTQNGAGRSAYVLQDADGRILQMVRPSPGVNLERYLNREVGVVGRNSSDQRLDKPLVVADRIVVLERHR